MPGLIGSRVNAWMHRPVYEMMADALDLQPDDDLLDVACGSGDFLAVHNAPCAGTLQQLR
jgi:ubiquinone/menaquinone biosynthesis C-methylase UbiE